MTIDKIKNAIQRDCAQLACDDFTKSANSIIEDFYNGYDPVFYYRTDEIRDSAFPYKKGTTGGVTIDIGGTNWEYKSMTMWEAGIRGLPEGYKGHVGRFVSNIEEFGIKGASSPHEALTQLEQVWGDKRQNEINAIIDKYMSQLEI